MAKFRVEMVDGRTYEVEAPEGTPQETLLAAIQQRDPFALKSTEALEAAPSAPFKAADIGRAAKAGIAGGLQSLTDIFGAGNVASQYLEEAQKAAYQGMSPERIEEMQRREELKKRAEGKGLGKEISSYLGGFAEAPLQTAVQALAGSAPIIASSALPGGPAAGIARLLSAARGPTAVGAAMGLGGQKGQDYETVKQALLEQGVPEPEAERRAQEASAYSMQNVLRQAGAAAAGAAEGRFGVEPAIGKLLTRRTATGAVKPPTWDVAIGQSILGEAAPEALQAAVGQIGTNQALNQAGIPTEITKGLAGTVAHDALVGAVLGLGLSPAQKANMTRDFEATKREELRKRQEEEQAKIAEIERRQQEEYEKAGYAAVQKPLAPADLTKNPLGSFTKEELQPEVVQYIDNFRNQMGLPKIEQYSVEDIADAMPGLDKERERQALGEIVGKKAGYTPETTVSVQNVLDQALAKNIDIEGKGFTDFLGRTTGTTDFKEMTDPQLFAAYKAISALPDSPTVREMEGGSNATRFDDTQYKAALQALDTALDNFKRPVSLAAAVDEIKFASGLRSDRAATALLEEAINRGDLDEVQTPRFEVIQPATGEILGRRYDTREEAESAAPEGAEVREVAERQIAPPSRVATLPEGYEIQEGLLKTGEAPQAFDVKAGDQILSRVKTEEEAQAKLESYTKTRASEAANAQKVIDKQNKRVADSQQRLNAMEAAGQGRTAEYQKAVAKHAGLVNEVNKIIARQTDRIRKFDPNITPISIAPVGAKAVGRTGFTVLKEGVPVTTLPTREEAEKAILGELTTGRLEELAQKKERRGLGTKAAEEIERRAGRLKPEKAPEVEALEQNLRKVLDKFGLKDVALEVAEAIAGGKAGGSYLNNLIKVALDEKNPVRTLRHESLHALRDLGFFSDKQWNALTNQARSKWIDTYLKQRNIDGQPIKAGEMSRYDAYVRAYKGDIDAIVEEAIADAFADFDATKAPPGMLSAILKRLQAFFEALRNALNGAGFQTAEDVFGKIERAELTPTKKAEGTEKLSVKGQEAAQKVIDAVQDKLIIDPKLYSATSLEMQTGKSGDKQFKQQDLGGIPEIVNFLEKRRRDSGVPILDISKPADRELLSQLMAAEAMASINAGGAALEWYDETVAKTIGMAALKYQELGTDPDKQMAFKIATAIASQGMNVEDNLKFAMQQYDYFDKNGRFEELGKGTDASAMKANYVLANKMMDEYTLGELRKFLQTPFKVEELRAAGFKIGGELGEETVLGSSIFGPKIGFGFYSNLNGNFEPVTMDMWFMRLIGRLTGNLRVFEADLFKSQMDRFRQAFDEAGMDGVYADEFKSDIVEKARKDDDEAVKLARIVNSVFTSDFKNNRALYDEGAKKKTELVYAAQNVLKSVDSPKDAPDNGTERIQLRDVVKRTVDRIERAIGKRIPPASLQALVWYPEQELYKALGAKLRVTSQDYAGAMKKILEGEGYGTKELDAAARSGARQVQQMANKPVGSTVKPTGEKPTAPYTEGERAEFLERATTKSIIEQERKAPKRRKVVFEVAPDPNNIEVTAAWRQLPTEDRLRISEKVAKQILGRAMEATGASGRVVSQVGSYLEDTNPSFALFLDKGNSVDVSKFLGYVLGQDSMMVISPRPGPGLDKVGAVIVDVNTNDSAKIDAVYQKLREIEVNNEKPVGGQSTMNGKMIVLNYSNLETEQLAQAIRSKLQGEYDVAITDVYSAFPEKDSYDYSDPSADPRGAQGDLRRTARTLRDQATEALAAELQTAAAPKEKLSLRASIDPSLMEMVDRTTHQRDEKTFVQSITEAIAPKSWSHFRQQALNRYNALSVADKIRAEKMGGKYLMADVSAESAALMSDLAAGVSASALGVHDRNGGIPVYRNGITTVWNDNGNIKGPTAIFAPLAKYNDPAVYQLYQFWAGAKRGRRLLAEGKERLYTQAEITRANELLQQFPEFESIQQEWIKYNNGLMEYAVATGVLSRERADEFMRYSDYIPFYRQLDGESSVGPKIFQAISGVKPPKKIKGGEQPLDDFLETVVRNTQSIIQSGMKTVAAQRAVKLAVDIGLGERLPNKKSGPDIVTVLENGQEVSYAVADPLFIEAIKSLNLPDLPFIGLLSGPANLLRNLVTKDPGFMLANMMRDSMAAWVTSGVNMTPVSSTVINFTKAFAGKSPEFEALLNAGVIGGYEFSQNVIEGAKTLEKSLGKAAGVRPSGLAAAATPFKSLWETLERGTTASDAATRIEVYKQVLAETGNEAEALYRALEVMNFNRKGSSAVVRILTAAVPFLNARMQGLDVMYRAAFGEMATKDAAAIQRAFFVRGMTIAAISCMYWALTHDDDEYKKQEEETKDNNWLIPSLGVKIPIPFEVGVLFKVIPERIMAYTFGEDTGQDFLRSMGRNLAATLMINPIPQTALPVVEATTNFSFFTMRPIVGQGMEDVAPQFQVGPSTSIIAEEIGRALGISPMKLDHMIKGYTGTMGMYMIDLIDSILNVNRDSPRPAARFEQLPVIKRFALDPEARGNVTAYYDLKNSVDEAVRTSNYLERSQNFDAYGPYMEETVNMLATRDYVLDLEKTMKEFREMKTLIRASDMSSTDKRDALIEVNRMEDQLTQNIRQIRSFARQ